MIRSAWELSTGQDDNEIYLFGGFSFTIDEVSFNCPKIELNLHACNGNVGFLDEIEFEFETDESDCFESDFIFLDSTRKIKIYQFDPSSETGIIDDFETLNPCDSLKLTYYICSGNMNDCDGLDINVRAILPSPCDSIELVFKFDRIIIVPEIGDGQDVFNGELELQLKERVVKFKSEINFSILNLNNMKLIEGTANTVMDIKQEMKKNELNPGLYVIKYSFKNWPEVHFEKIYYTN